MSNLPTTPVDIASEINSANVAFEQSTGAYIDNVGKLLDHAKQMLSSHKSGDFDAWVDSALQISRRHANRIHNAWETRQGLIESGPIGLDALPATESHCRELAKLKDPKQQAKVWAAIVDSSEQITAQTIRRAVVKVLPAKSKKPTAGKATVTVVEQNTSDESEPTLDELKNELIEVLQRFINAKATGQQPFKPLRAVIRDSYPTIFEQMLVKG